MNPDLFPIPESKPPLLATLRRAYDEAEAILREAEDYADDTGEQVPTQVRRAFAQARRDLAYEEARLASIK